MSGIAAITFGRMNPPTIGHERLITVLSKMFWAHDRFLFLSGTEDDSRNPLPFDYKLELCQEAFQSIDTYVMSFAKKDFFDAVKAISDHGYSQLHVLVGSDRAGELRERLPMYNGFGKLFNFWKIEVHELPRDDRDEIAEMSSSKLRNAVINGDFEMFENGLPTKIRHRAKEIYREIADRCMQEVTSP